MPHSATATDIPALRIRFGSERTELVAQDGAETLNLAVPLLSGQAIEGLKLPGGSVRRSGKLLLISSPTRLIGAATVDTDDRLEDPVHDVYLEALAACKERGMCLHRAWNYVPGINAQTHGLERYRQFNIGRWLAFEKHFGRDLRSFMPAASGVGSHGNRYALLFIAGKTHPVYLENPSQVPAYHYPADYGPRPPSFARAVLIENDREITGYVSGTASIEGHRSVGEGDWHTQFRTTMHNLQIMFERMGMEDALQRESDVQIRDFRCYLRHAESFPLIRDWLMEETNLDVSRITFLQSDICRAELDIEMEAILAKRTA
jgi:chorismate lyase/3-hydroxybenzoate synthase